MGRLPIETQSEEMTPHDLERLERFAAGERGLRDEALRVFHNVLIRCRTNRSPLPRGDLHFEFMSEVDSPCPDLALRASYRERLRNL